MAPLCLPKSTKNAPKSDPKRHQNFDRFLHRFFIDFGSVLASNLGPTWGPRRLQNQKKASKTLRCSSPRAVRNVTLLLNTVLGRLGSVLASNLALFWAILAPFWAVLAPSWLRFGFETPLLIANLRAPRDGRRSSPNGGFN